MNVMSSVNNHETAGCSLLFHGCSAHQLDPAVALDALPMLHVATVHKKLNKNIPVCIERLQLNDSRHITTLVLLRFSWSKLKRAMLQLETKADQTSKG